MAAVTLLFLVEIWQRRWISDDGLIVVRTVRQLLAGNGPVFNAFERAESNTSTLWTYLLALVALVTRGDVVWLALVLGGALSLGGLVLAMDAARRWHRSRDGQEAILPAGALAVIAIHPFADYATSGLENGLCLLWIGLAWWLLVELRPDRSPRYVLVTAIVIGLGPLVRPDFAVATGLFLVAGWLLVRPRWARTLRLAGAAIALPLAYEIFRAGYYGVLVPLPALAKSASAAQLDRGYAYFHEFVAVYWFWLPLAAMAAMLAVALWRRALGRRDAILIAVPVLSGLVLALYVIRIGGDFMHARMLLAPSLLVLLPVFAIPARRLVMRVGFAAWAVFVFVISHKGAVNPTSELVEDERLGYIRFTHSAHPTTEADYIAGEGSPAVEVAKAVRNKEHALISEGAIHIPARADHPGTVVFAVGRLGTGGIVTPIEGTVADTLGLANPIGAHLQVNSVGNMAGHEKMLPWQWLLADFADPAADFAQIDKVSGWSVVAARHASTCGALAEMLASVREPMTAGRFWANLTGAWRRTRLVVPANPFVAETKFCGTPPRLRTFATSSLEAYGWSLTYVDDGETHAGRTNGYSSQLGIHDNHTEWVVIELQKARDVSSVVLHPGNAQGFPIDFRIQIWDGLRWQDRAVQHDYAMPPADTPQVFRWATPDRTNQIRVYATKLRDVPPDGYMLQLAEIEVR